jgi:prephenate dehydratase
MTTRGIRGATTAAEDSEAAMVEATQELLEAMVAANDLDPSDLASAIFTATPDLTAVHPALAARKMGWHHVPLLSASEIAVPDSIPNCVRVLLHWNTDRPLRHQPCLPAWRHARRPDLQMDEPTAEPVVAAPSRSPVALMAAVRRSPIRRRAPTRRRRSSCTSLQTGTVACHSFEDIFRGGGWERYTGVLLVGNSQAGSINQAFDSCWITTCAWWARSSSGAPLPAGAAGTTRRHPPHRSHPQALEQCERYLKNHGWEAVPAYDTAGAARELAADPEPNTAVIASALAGQTYGLELLASGIEDSPDNTTRFFLLGREEPPAGRHNKTSIVFATLHTPGALYHVLGELASRNINLTKIESRPRRNRPWHYVFYVDLEGHWQDSAVNRALMGLLAPPSSSC